MADKHDAAMMENLYWWGIPTLYRCPNEGPEGADIALVGVPHSAGNGTTERDQHLGPRALRNVSSVSRRVHGGFGIDPWALAKIVDVGDVPFPRANDNEACIEDITQFYGGLIPLARGLSPSVEIIRSPAGLCRLWAVGRSPKVSLFVFCIWTRIRMCSPRWIIS